MTSQPIPQVSDWHKVTDAERNRTVLVERVDDTFHVRRDFGFGFDDSAVTVITAHELAGMRPGRYDLSLFNDTAFIGYEITLSDRRETPHTA